MVAVLFVCELLVVLTVVDRYLLWLIIVGLLVVGWFGGFFRFRFVYLDTYLVGLRLILGFIWTCWWD